MTLPILIGGSHQHNLHSPKRAGDVGYDMVISEFKRIPPLGHATLRTGIRVALPRGVWAEIKARSSTWGRYCLLVVNDVIDEGYTGELTVRVINLGGSAMCVTEGMRIAQLVLHESVVRELVPTSHLPATERGDQGLGSTGT